MQLSQNDITSYKNSLIEFLEKEKEISRREINKRKSQSDTTALAYMGEFNMINKIIDLINSK